MYVQITAQMVRELEAEHYSIKNISQFPRYLQFFQEISIPKSILSQFFVISIPKWRFKIFRLHYNLICQTRDKSFHRFSYEDFLIAYVAAEQAWSVVSYDKDILEYLQAYLDFTAIYPSEVGLLPSDSFILIDTNLIVEYIKDMRGHQRELASLFRVNPSITFLFAEPIIKEAIRVHERKIGGKEDYFKIHGIPKGAQLEDFIDNFEGFSSNNSARRNSRKLNRARRPRKYAKYQHYKY